MYYGRTIRDTNGNKPQCLIIIEWHERSKERVLFYIDLPTVTLRDRTGQLSGCKRRMRVIFDPLS